MIHAPSARGLSLALGPFQRAGRSVSRSPGGSLGSPGGPLFPRGSGLFSPVQTRQTLTDPRRGGVAGPPAPRFAPGLGFNPHSGSAAPRFRPIDL